MDYTWFYLAIIPPFLFAVTNHIDSNLLVNYFKEGGVGTLILISSLLSILPIPLILWFEPNVLSVDASNIPILALTGLLNVGVIWFYLRALQEDEPSVVIIFYQLVPVIGLILGYFILGEVISAAQFVAMLIILLGTSIVSFDFDDKNRYKFRKHTVLNMFVACFCWAFETVLLKKVALEENMWRSLFWEQAMMVVVGLVVFIMMPTYRKHFLIALKRNSRAILGLNAANETLYIMGNIVGAFATMLAPVALVLLAQPFQSIFVFMIGTLLILFFPKMTTGTLEGKQLAQKVLAIAITTVGTYLLLTS